MEPIATLAEYASPAFASSQNLQLAVRYSLHEEPIERHCHPDFYELVLVRGGQALHKVDDLSYSIGPGNIFLIPPGSFHFYTQTRELGIYNILFGANLLRHFREDLVSFPNFYLLFQNFSEKNPAPYLTMSNQFFPMVLELLEEIIQEQEACQRGCRTAILSNFMRVILLICRHATPGAKNALNNSGYKLSQLLARLEAAPEEEWTLELMAKTINMSISNFRQQFRRMTGRPPAQYLIELRLKKAAYMLLKPDSPIGEVALRCGFCDSNYFARLFRSRYQLSPREFRSRGGGV